MVGGKGWGGTEGCSRELEFIRRSVEEGPVRKRAAGRDGNGGKQKEAAGSYTSRGVEKGLDRKRAATGGAEGSNKKL